MNIKDLYHDLILEHGTNPRNYQTLNNASCSACGINPLCGDSITIYLQCDQDKIINATFSGSGCAIAMASASLLTEALKNQSLQFANELFATFHAMLTTEQACPPDMGKLNALANVRAYPIRIKCATLAWHTMMDALKQQSTC